MSEKLEIDVQYTDQVVELMDGVGYTYVGMVAKEEPRHYKYPLYLPTEVIFNPIDQQPIVVFL
jgi:hypothetical protein